VFDLRQLRCFVRAAELGSVTAAAEGLGLSTPRVQQQIGLLEDALGARLLERAAAGVVVTDAGLAFLAQARLILRHAADAVHAAQEARLSGDVSIGMPPTIASVLGLPLLLAMSERYPHVKLHLVEALSGDIAAMLQARRLDLAVAYRAEAARRWSVLPLVDEALFIIGRADLPGMPEGDSASLAVLRDVPLVLPSGAHDLRVLVNALFRRAGAQPNVLAEIDGLPLLMDAVGTGLAATVQPGAALARAATGALRMVRVEDADARRQPLLATLSEDELSAPSRAARGVLCEVARSLVEEGRWPGAGLPVPLRP